MEAPPPPPPDFNMNVVRVVPRIGLGFCSGGSFIFGNSTHSIYYSMQYINSYDCDFVSLQGSLFLYTRI